jgi:hypothetical protein
MTENFDEALEIARLLKGARQNLSALADRVLTLDPGQEIFIGSIPYRVMPDRSLKRLSPAPANAARRIGRKFRPAIEEKEE